MQPLVAAKNYKGCNRRLCRSLKVTRVVCNGYCITHCIAYNRRGGRGEGYESILERTSIASTKGGMRLFTSTSCRVKSNF